MKSLGVSKLDKPWPSTGINADMKRAPFKPTPLTLNPKPKAQHPKLQALNPQILKPKAVRAKEPSRVA